MTPSTSDTTTLALARMRAVARARWRLAGALTISMVCVYFGFLSLVAWSPGLLGTTLVPGLTLGVLLGALVIVCAWVLTWVYVRWANAVYDPMVAEQRAALRVAQTAAQTAAQAVAQTAAQTATQAAAQAVAQAAVPPAVSRTPAVDASTRDDA